MEGHVGIWSGGARGVPLLVGNFLSIGLALWTEFSPLRRFLPSNVRTRIINYHSQCLLYWFTLNIPTDYEPGLAQ